MQLFMHPIREFFLLRCYHVPYTWLVLHISGDLIVSMLLLILRQLLHPQLCPQALALLEKSPIVRRGLHRLQSILVQAFSHYTS